MALTRVQGTVKVSGFGTTVTIPAFSTLPTVGNGLVVTLCLWNEAVPTSCQDNRGNTYVLAVRSPLGIQGFAAVYYCSKIAASAAPFTITLTLPGTNWFLAGAIEVSGVGTGLTVDRTASNFFATGGGGTGLTAPLTATDVFAVAAVNVKAGLTALPVETVSPPWTQEHEELSSTNTAGEADSRALTGVSGTTTSCSWTPSPSGASACVLAVFSAAIPIVTLPAVGTASFAVAGSGVGAFTAAVSGIGSASFAFAGAAPATGLAGAVGSAAFAFEASGSSPVISLASVDVTLTIVRQVSRVLTVVDHVDRVLTI